MQNKSESRARAALHADVADLPFIVTEKMVQERIASHRSSLSRMALVGVGSVAALLVAALFVVIQPTPTADVNLGVGENLSFPVVTPEPGLPQPLVLPTGIFQAARPFDGTCVAIEVTGAGQTPIAALWWNAGAGDDCTTPPSSEIVASVAHLQAPLLRIEIGSTDGYVREVTLRFTGATEDEIRFARNNEFEVPFRRID